MQRVEGVWNSLGGAKSARAALDFALHDWLGKRAGMPTFQMLGGSTDAIVPTSLTVGINPPEIARERTLDLMHRLSPRRLKIKLGNPEGIDADRSMFEAVRSAAPPGISLRVDANGGWTVDSARIMIRWLAERGVEYVEQPLPLGQEEDLPALFRDSPLPLFADESCRMADDVPKLADRVHGINLKLMKAGGIREGLRVIHAARAHGLMVMMGCMSESSLAISASVALSPYADYLDLDSHLNLSPDHFTGLTWVDGLVLPSDQPGLGVSRIGIAN
jgi:muconate cycloisomerase